MEFYIFVDLYTFVYWLRFAWHW